jgi:hypothetical protein
MSRAAPGSTLRRSAIAAFVGIDGLLIAPHASAEDDAEPVHLTYHAPAQCPDESALLEMVSRDGGRLVRVPDETPARSFVLRIEGGDLLRGRLLVRGPTARKPLAKSAIAIAKWWFARSRCSSRCR